MRCRSLCLQTSNPAYCFLLKSLCFSCDYPLSNF
nr:MAG TPA: hypothetical protein [Caudoviricetes sp.]